MQILQMFPVRQQMGYLHYSADLELCMPSVLFSANVCRDSCSFQPCLTMVFLCSLKRRLSMRSVSLIFHDDAETSLLRKNLSSLEPLKGEQIIQFSGSMHPIKENLLQIPLISTGSRTLEMEKIYCTYWSPRRVAL